MRVNDASFSAQVGGNICLGLYVDVLGAIKLGRTARPDAIRAQSLDGLFFDLLVRIEVVEIVGCKVRNCATVCELRLGAGWSILWSVRAMDGTPGKTGFAISPFHQWHGLPNNDRDSLGFGNLKGSSFGDKRFWNPIID